MRNASSVKIGKHLFQAEGNPCSTWSKVFESLSGEKITVVVVCESLAQMGQPRGIVNQVAIDAIKDEFAQIVDEVDISTASLKLYLRRSINQVHKKVLGAFEAGVVPRLHATVSSLTCIAIVKNHAVIAHIGENRTYHLQEGNINHITNDHLTTSSEVPASPIGKYNILTRALGNDQVDHEADFNESYLKPGDELIICNHSIWSLISDQEMANQLKMKLAPKKKARKIVENAIRTMGKVLGGDTQMDCVTLVLKVEG